MPMTRSLLAAVLAATIVAGTVPLAVTGQDAVAGAAPVIPLPATLDAAIVRAGTAIGTDPAALADAVRAWVRPEAYPGSMKGARGAILTGAANDIDAALLVRDLLAAADPAVPTRFATCDLALPVAEPDWAAEPRLVDGADELALATADLDAAQAYLGLADLRSHARESIDAALPALTDAVAASGIAAPAPSAPVAATHTWLQAELGGTWTDIDPAGDAVGAAPCAASGTTPDLDPATGWQVTLDVRAEQLGASGPVTRTLLTLDRPLADLAASRIAVAFGEPNGLVERPAVETAGVPYTPVVRIDEIGRAHV